MLAHVISATYTQKKSYNYELFLKGDYPTILFQKERCSSLFLISEEK